MSRETYVMRGGQLVPVSEATPLPRHGISFGSGPTVISDSMPAARHMASGRYHESKSAFRRDTKSYGCVEVGNDAPMERARGKVNLPKPHADVAQAWAQLEAKQ